MRRLLLLFVVSGALALQTPVEFVCPMDRDVRSSVPGKCPRCGMTLVANLPEPVDIPLDLRVTPPEIPAARPIDLEFRAGDPPTAMFEVVHERLFHLFVVSQDLSYFAHLHPELGADSVFRLRTVLPKPGTYRLLADFYPTGGTPQFVPKTISTAGYDVPLESAIPHLDPDLAPQRGQNLTAELRLDPPRPLAGKKTMLFLHLSPAEGLQPYIGAWAHLLAVSHDLVDTIHEHPFIANGGPDMQFNIFFPREATYKIWIQIQRQGVVNTVAFVVPVTAIR